MKMGERFEAIKRLLLVLGIGIVCVLAFFAGLIAVSSVFGFYGFVTYFVVILSILMYVTYRMYLDDVRKENPVKR